MTSVDAATRVVFGRSGHATLRAGVEKISLTPSGDPGESSSSHPSLTSDGRYAAFSSLASDLVSGDTNGMSDVFVRDLWAGTTERVSLDASGGQFAGDAKDPTISADGRFVAFHAREGQHSQIFVRDRQAGTTARITDGNDDSFDAHISGDGSRIAWVSRASNLVEGDDNQNADVFVHDLASGVTKRVSVGTDGQQANADNYYASISGDGRYVAFQSYASALGTPRNSIAIYRHEVDTGRTELISKGDDGKALVGESCSPSISADGNKIAFHCTAMNDGKRAQVYVHDCTTGKNTKVSVNNKGEEADDNCWLPVISADGRYVAYESTANNMGDASAFQTRRVYVSDTESARTECLTPLTPGFFQGTHAAISGDGRVIAFEMGGHVVGGGKRDSGCDVAVARNLTVTAIRDDEAQKILDEAARSIKPAGKITVGAREIDIAGVKVPVKRS